MEWFSKTATGMELVQQSSSSVIGVAVGLTEREGSPETQLQIAMFAAGNPRTEVRIEILCIQFEEGKLDT